jgi:hypothetical protein
VSAATFDSAHLLDDDAVKRFLTEGYLLVRPDLPPEFHEDVCRRIDAVLARRGNPGNEIYEEVPPLREVYDHPTVRGALVSLLGPGVRMNPHRHCHASPPGMRGQQWHQDDVNKRHHRIERVLAMYYPHEVTPEMGPTLILPFTQYRNAPTARMASYGTFAHQVALAVPAGTVAITHYDLWHRASPNRSDRTRYMLKFLFDRTEEPDAPSWRADPARREAMLTEFIRVWPATDSQTDAYKHRIIWMNLWNWLWGGGPPEDSIIDRYP